MAFGEDLILRSKLQPPRVRRWVLSRSRLHAELNAATDYRLTVLAAPTGYGKSTLLAGWLANAQPSFAWYSVGHLDTDPFIFLLHLIYAFRGRWPGLGERALEFLEREGGKAGTPAERLNACRPALRLFVNDLCALLTEDTFLVLDDFHLVDSQREVVTLTEELVAILPPTLHLVVSSRHRPAFSRWLDWQVHQEFLYLDRDCLAFGPQETAQLFEQCYGCRLDGPRATRLASETEGWVIALQMVWQNLQGDPARLDTMLQDLPHNMSNLFEYLAQDVLGRQEADLQRFLLDSAVLRRMNCATCDFVLERPAGQSKLILHYLAEAGLFISVQGDEPNRIYRYHHLFSEFLYSRLSADDPDRLRHLHCRAALYYAQVNQPEEALPHYLAGQDWDGAAHLLESGLGQRLIETGRLERLEHWLANLPPEFLEQQPALLLLQGDYLRLTSRFEEAATVYRQAANLYEARQELNGLAQAYRRRGLVYLDTVQPALAEEWLERGLEAAEATPDQLLQATLLRDLAENKLNRGHPLVARELHRQALTLLGEPADTPLDVRILLRSGEIRQATEYLERTERLEGDTPLQRAGRSHREGLLVLSLLYSGQGEAAKAAHCAEQGIELARELHTPFTEAVAWLRLGHALTVAGEYDRALEAYNKGTALGEQLQVRRLQAEGLMGRCVLYGCAGKLDAARQAGEEGLQVARQAGDEWIEGFLQVSLAGSLATQGETAAALVVAQTAQALLETCGDRLGVSLARLWAALARQDPATLREAALACQQAGYGFLLERPTFFGPKQLTILAQLQEALQSPPESGPASPTPAASRLLRVSTLGSFTVWRADGSEIGVRDWQREKSRQLFQLLLTWRNQPLFKEQILEYLWPESDPAGADSRFKVALNALVQALEPERSSRAQSSYILRSGSGASLAYRLNTDPTLFWLDAAEFERQTNLAIQAETDPARSPADILNLYSAALALYRGDYLPGSLYDDWAAPERERLLALFLTAAEKFSRRLAAQGDWERCLVVCRQILARDNCWEEAYRLMMTALWKQGHRTAALRAYEKCASTLAHELEIEPLPQTSQLYQQILAS